MGTLISATQCPVKQLGEGLALAQPQGGQDMAWRNISVWGGSCLRQQEQETCSHLSRPDIKDQGQKLSGSIPKAHPRWPVSSSKPVR